MLPLLWFSLWSPAPAALAAGDDGAAALQAADKVFTPAQRSAIVAIVRQALKQDPSILTDAFSSMRAAVAQDEAQRVRKALKANWHKIAQAPEWASQGPHAGRPVIVAFIDPRCGFCRRETPVVQSWLKSHPHVRYMERIIPILGAGSLQGARAIYAAGLQGRYAPMRDRVVMSSTTPNQAQLDAMAQSLGLDMGRFHTDMQGHEVTKLITSNLEAAQLLGIDGTPTFVIGRSQLVPGAVDADRLSALASQAAHEDDD
ncbi:DsbA family protein [Formicincola oecophyllae]|nr:DsbA family protein [Formicincola oecophyllae]